MTKAKAQQQVEAYLRTIDGKSVPADLVAASVQAILDLAK